MPKLNLTDAFCRGAKAVTGELVEYADTKERGLALRVTAAGIRSWTFRYRDPAGKQKRLSLGRLEDVSLYDARAAAAAERTKIHAGSDPATVRRIAKEKVAVAFRAETVKEVGERYLAEAAVGRHRANGRVKGASTIAGERYYFDRLVVPRFGKDRLEDLTRARIQAFVNDVADEHAPSAARQARVVLQAIFAFAAWQEIVQVNPCQFVTVPSFETRDRVLTDHELRFLWTVLENAPDTEKLYVSRSVVLAVMIAAATLQRRAEVTGMQKSELDFDAKTWTIPSSRTKNRRMHIVPLSDLAMRLIREALALSPADSRCVFPSPRDGDKPILPAALSHAFRRVLDSQKVGGMRPHDLRRTGATAITSERIGMPRFTVSQVLNHTSDSGGTAAVTAIYDRNAYMREKRAALDAWAALLIEIVEGKERPDNLVQFVR